MHVPQAVVNGAQADCFASERLADEHELAAPLHAAVRANTSSLEVLAVAVLCQLARHRSWRQLVDLGRRLHAERLVRPLLVVALLEHIERALLGADRRPWRRGRLCFQGLVEPLVSAILIWPTWFDQHGDHAKAHEPDAEPRQPAKAVGTERRAAVAQHEPRQPEGVERTLEPTTDVCRLRAHHGLADQRGSAVHIVDRQRIAARAVADTKPALVVHRPHVVGRPGFDPRRRRRLPTWAASTRLHDSGSLQDLIDGAARRPVLIRALAIQRPKDLLRAPGRVRLPHSQNRRFLLRRRLVGVHLRRTRAIGQAWQPALGMARQHLVAGLPADPESLAQRLHRLLAPQRGLHELPSLHLRLGLDPWHPDTRPALTTAVTSKCHPCARTRVSPMYPGWTRRSPTIGPALSPTFS